VLVYYTLFGGYMGTIREITKKDGSVMHHAEIRLRGYPPQ